MLSRPSLEGAVIHRETVFVALIEYLLRHEQWQAIRTKNERSKNRVPADTVIGRGS
jgi:hypothetical protein